MNINNNFLFSISGFKLYCIKSFKVKSSTLFDYIHNKSWLIKIQMSKCVHCGKVFRNMERKGPAVGEMVEFLRKLGKMKEGEVCGHVCDKCWTNITRKITKTFCEAQQNQPVALNGDEQLQHLIHSIPRALLFRDVHGPSAKSRNVPVYREPQLHTPGILSTTLPPWPTTIRNAPKKPDDLQYKSFFNFFSPARFRNPTVRNNLVEPQPSTSKSCTPIVFWSESKTTV